MTESMVNVTRTTVALVSVVRMRRRRMLFTPTEKATPARGARPRSDDSTPCAASTTFFRPASNRAYRMNMTKAASPTMANARSTIIGVWDSAKAGCNPANAADVPTKTARKTTICARMSVHGEANFVRKKLKGITSARKAATALMRSVIVERTRRYERKAWLSAWTARAWKSRSAPSVRAASARSRLSPARR